MSFSLPLKPESAFKTVLLRGHRRGVGPGRGIRLAALRVPLVVKLVGANLFVVAVLLAAWVTGGGRMHALVGVIALLVIGVHLGLVLVALRPIHDLETAA